MLTNMYPLIVVMMVVAILATITDNIIPMTIGVMFFIGHTWLSERRRQKKQAEVKQ